MTHGNYKDPRERFQQRFQQGATDACWEWQGATDRKGYGLMWAGAELRKNAACMSAHRLAWMFRHGPITSEQHVLHKCDNPRCVNPDHLFLGTQAANNADMRAKNRHQHGARHYRATLTEEQARAIKCSAEPIRVAAERYGVSYEVARRIRNGTRWSHI